MSADPFLPQRRARYAGKHPRRFDEKYKEHDAARYAEEASKIVLGGKTLAGTHRSVCVAEILAILDPRPGQVVLDATLGYGGHAREILARIIPGGCLWGIDADPVEITRTVARLTALGYGEEVFKARCMNFAGVSRLAAEAGQGFDLILADLGVSSMQLDDPARGFTFKHEGPLDLRLNPGRGQSAAALLQSLSEKDFEQILIAHADEPQAKGIARAVFKCRQPILTTTALCAAVRRALPRPSTDAAEEENTRSVRRTFQALRIAVNDEFQVLEQFLRHLPFCLKPGGKAAILTFHSGEDNRVMQALEAGCVSGVYAAISREPIRAGAQERHDNPRSKSAVLRWAQRSL